MEKNIKATYNINCNWSAKGVDAKGNSTGNWTADVILFDDNTVIGLAIDDGHNQTTHIISGVMLPNSGIMLYKTNVCDYRYDPIIFIATSTNKDNNYDGEYLVKAPFSGLHVLGSTEMTAEQVILTDTRKKFIQKYYNNLKEEACNNSFYINCIIAESESIDINSFKLAIDAQEKQQKELSANKTENSIIDEETDDPFYDPTLPF